MHKRRVAESKDVIECKTCASGVAETDENCVTDSTRRVASFVYLTDEMYAAGGCLSAVMTRVRLAWRKFDKLSAVLCGQKWSVTMTEKLYRMKLRKAIINGGETWAMREEERALCCRRR